MESITIKDIAKKCGVAVSTVSRALNNHPDINEETKQSIMETIKEYNYIPNNSARNLKRSESKTIAVLIKGIDNPFFQTMIKVFEEAIKEERYTFILQRIDTNENEVENALALIKEKRLRGIVFLGGSFSHSEEQLKQISIPFVLCTIGMTEDINKRTYSSVAVDDVKESAKMVAYLCDLGHKRIAILAAGKDDSSIGKLRLEGYLKALKVQNRELYSPMIRYTKSGKNAYTMENGYCLMRELLDSGEDCSAVFAISDSMAIGASKAILEAGKRIPEDYAIAGFDGMEMGYYYHPSITTIRQPVEEMALETIVILFDMIKKKKPHKHCVFEGELLVRESTN